MFAVYHKQVRGHRKHVEEGAHMRCIWSKTDFVGPTCKITCENNYYCTSNRKYNFLGLHKCTLLLVHKIPIKLLSECQEEPQQISFHKWSIVVLAMMLCLIYLYKK
ncbi:hypothetical protein XENOCAPTIV_000451 [Xenoophorus captivus]|uniref:Beta-microseminoprotein n=1 Tax=Xenoophorus captivus TaxID=1517983 RepID=A0ABV0QFN1_9TELE